jgi:hypothetical protein
MDSLEPPSENSSWRFDVAFTKIKHGHAIKLSANNYRNFPYLTEFKANFSRIVSWFAHSWVRLSRWLRNVMRLTRKSAHAQDIRKTQKVVDELDVTWKAYCVDDCLGKKKNRYLKKQEEKLSWTRLWWKRKALVNLNQRYQCHETQLP